MLNLSLRKEKQKRNKQAEEKGLNEVSKNLNATSRLCLVFLFGNFIECGNYDTG